MRCVYNENTNKYNNSGGSVMKNAYIHVRVNEMDKTNAESILKEIGLDMSTVITTLLKKIQAVGGVPFEMTNENLIIEDVKATMAMENMYLDDEDIEMLKAYKCDGSLSDKNILKTLDMKYRRK